LLKSNTLAYLLQSINYGANYFITLASCFKAKLVKILKSNGLKLLAKLMPKFVLRLKVFKVHLRVRF